MSDVVLSIKDISKLYRLGLVGTGTASDDLKRWWHRIRGKEDPFMKVGASNDRSADAESDYVWALRDINLEIKQGEVVGLIGANGAGKSTLLKLLSQVTAPTTGKIRVKGRLSSLLEVGTGFHRELTGRENIYLNGAILGMTKQEIRQKLDEIVDFSGVAMYIDTPVKRYSSGMLVRLGFAVAAHLEPDILVVDEVLAVGDAEFQRKAIGKMRNVSEQFGRTVLFVSHNMNSIKTLCTRGVFLKNGRIEGDGDVDEMIDRYLAQEVQRSTHAEWKTDHPGNENAILHYVQINNFSDGEVSHVTIKDRVGIEMGFEVLRDIGKPFVPNLHVHDSYGNAVFVGADYDSDEITQPGRYITTFWIPGDLLNTGIYSFGVALSSFVPTKAHFYAKNAIHLDVMENLNDRQTEYKSSFPGVIRPKIECDTNRINNFSKI